MDREDEAHDDFIGRSIGNFVVVARIGSGAMGAVYLAEHPLIGRQLAVKVLHPHLARERSIVARLFTEARSAFEVRSANIVDIIDFGVLPDQTTYFLMEWLDGCSLADELTRGPLGAERAVSIALGIARALDAAHEGSVVHRDLKPANVFLVERDGTPDVVKVLDFGIAKVTSEDDPAALRGQLLGTPAYMAPEQCRGDDVDGRSDVYALGVILYEMLTGARPFGHRETREVLHGHMFDRPPLPSEFVPSISPALEQVVVRAMEKDPAARWQSARELRDALAGLAVEHGHHGAPRGGGAPGPVDGEAATLAPGTGHQAVNATLSLLPSLDTVATGDPIKARGGG